MEKSILVKTIEKNFSDKLKAGVVWYSFISIINNLNLTKREIQLLSFINYRGTISSSSSKEEFCKLYNSSTPTVSNMVSKLSSLKLLVKEKSKTKINNNLRVDFDSDFVVRFFINVDKIDKDKIDKTEIITDGDQG